MNAGGELKLRKFDIDSMIDDCVVVMIAKRRTGKSFLCRDILYHKRGFPSGMVISPTEKANPFYGDFVPDLFIHDEYSSDTVESFLKRQEVLVQLQKKKPGLDARAFLCMDDCLYDSSFTKHNCIRSVFMNGRHYKTMFLLMMQYPLGITPALRTNIDYVFLLKETVNRKKLYEHYASLFGTFGTFCQAMDQCTQNYECMVIDNTNTSGKIEDTVFWYKAEAHPEFKIGAERYWRYHQARYDKDYKDRAAKAGVIGRKKGGVVVRRIADKKKKRKKKRR